MDLLINFADYSFKALEEIPLIKIEGQVFNIQTFP